MHSGRQEVSYLLLLGVAREVNFEVSLIGAKQDTLTA